MSSGTGSGAAGDGGAWLGGQGFGDEGFGGDEPDPAGHREAAAADLALRPAPDVALAVRVACQRLFAIESSFLDSYYTSLVHLVPIIRQTAQDEGRAVADGLARSVLWAALTDDPLEVVEATFESVGAEYYRQGFPEEGYHGAGHALLRSARDVYTTEWSSELSSGWVAYFAWLGAHLQEGARQARDAGVPSPVTTTPGHPPAGSDSGARPQPGPGDDAAPTPQVPQPRPHAPQRGWRRVVPNLFR